jgi:hypothetical protein
MKRDIEIYRQILLELEACSTPHADVRSLTNVDYETTAYHIRLLHEAGLIDAINMSSNDGETWSATALTHSGHDFLDTMMADTLWNKTKSIALQKFGTLSLEALKAAIPLALAHLK